jgi:acetylornithine deacetylase
VQGGLVNVVRSALEERVVAAVRESERGLVELVGDLVGFDTTARNEGDPPRDEAALQVCLKRRLESLGAETDLWEPEPTGSGNLFVPDHLDFAGRPQLAGRLAGAGSGRSLLLNGHIDAVTAEPRKRWTGLPQLVGIFGRPRTRFPCSQRSGVLRDAETCRHTIS